MSSRIYLAVDGFSLSPESYLRSADWPRQAPWPKVGENLDNTLKRVQRGIDGLEEMGECHRVAAIASNMLHYLVDTFKVYVEISRALQGGSGGRSEFGPHWTAVSIKQGLGFFTPSESRDDISVPRSINLLGVDTSDSKGRQGDAAATTAGGKQSVDAMLFLLQSSDALKCAFFWPSPGEQPHLIRSGPEQLQKIGFEPLA